MNAWIYSNGSQECERAAMLLKSMHNEFNEYILNEHFTEKQFRAEFGDEAEYPMIEIGVNHRGTLKETLNYLNKHNYKCSC